MLNKLISDKTECCDSSHTGIINILIIMISLRCLQREMFSVNVFIYSVRRKISEEQKCSESSWREQHINAVHVYDSALLVKYDNNAWVPFCRF